MAAGTDENEGLYDDCTHDVTEYDGDWMEWAGAGQTDNRTWNTGSDSTATAALSQPQQPAASSSIASSYTSFTGQTACQTATAPNVPVLHSIVNVTDLETGETHAHTPSRRTGTVTRPVYSGTGLLNAFMSVIVVMNSFGRPRAGSRICLISWGSHHC